MPGAEQVGRKTYTEDVYHEKFLQVTPFEVGVRILPMQHSAWAFAAMSDNAK